MDKKLYVPSSLEDILSKGSPVKVSLEDIQDDSVYQTSVTDNNKVLTPDEILEHMAEIESGSGVILKEVVKALVKNVELRVLTLYKRYDTEKKLTNLNEKALNRALQEAIQGWFLERIISMRGQTGYVENLDLAVERDIEVVNSMGITKEQADQLHKNGKIQLETYNKVINFLEKEEEKKK